MEDLKKEIESKCFKIIDNFILKIDRLKKLTCGFEVIITFENHYTKFSRKKSFIIIRSEDIEEIFKHFNKLINNKKK